MTGKHRFLALGDSYTIGEGVATAERWPAQLAAALRQDGVAIDDPRIIARTGWTTDELLAALKSAVPPVEQGYDLVTLLIGVNDQYRGRGVTTFREGFEKLLERATTFARGSARVVVVSIPDWSVTPFARNDERVAASIACEIDQFNAVARGFAESVGAAFVDVTGISRGAAHSPELLASDALHPSGAMYRLWVPAVQPVARKILQSGCL